MVALKSATFTAMMTYVVIHFYEGVPVSNIVSDTIAQPFPILDQHFQDEIF